MLKGLQLFAKFVAIFSDFNKFSSDFFRFKFIENAEKRRFWRAMPGGPHVRGLPPRWAHSCKITLMLPSQKKKPGNYLFLKVLF